MEQDSVQVQESQTGQKTVRCQTCEKSFPESDIGSPNSTALCVGFGLYYCSDKCELGLAPKRRQSRSRRGN